MEILYHIYKMGDPRLLDLRKPLSRPFWKSKNGSFHSCSFSKRFASINTATKNIVGLQTNLVYCTLDELKMKEKSTLFQRLDAEKHEKRFSLKVPLSMDIPGCYCQSQLLKDLSFISENMEKINKSGHIETIHVVLEQRFISKTISQWHYNPIFEGAAQEVLGNSNLKQVWIYRHHLGRLDKKLVCISK